MIRAAAAVFLGWLWTGGIVLGAESAPRKGWVIEAKWSLAGRDNTWRYSILGSRVRIDSANPDFLDPILLVDAQTGARILCHRHNRTWQDIPAPAPGAQAPPATAAPPAISAEPRGATARLEWISHGETRRILKLEAVSHEIKARGGETIEIWAVPEAEFGPFFAYQPTSPQSHGPQRLIDIWDAELRKRKLFPLLAIHKQGKHEIARFEVSSVESKEAGSLSDALFSVPAGYREVGKRR